VELRDRKTLAASDANHRNWRILPIVSAAAFVVSAFIRLILSNAGFGSNSPVCDLGQLRVDRIICHKSADQLAQGRET
jgi:hypothetical protein